MKLVILTALGVGGATVFGAVVGFLFKKISHRFSDIVLSFAAGVMLAAAVLGLILPSVETADVVAQRDGIVESVRVYAGTAAVRAGDAVSSGQIARPGLLRSRSQ